MRRLQGVRNVWQKQTPGRQRRMPGRLKPLWKWPKLTPSKPSMPMLNSSIDSKQNAQNSNASANRMAGQVGCSSDVVGISFQVLLCVIAVGGLSPLLCSHRWHTSYWDDRPCSSDGIGCALVHHAVGNRGFT